MLVCLHNHTYIHTHTHTHTSTLIYPNQFLYVLITSTYLLLLPPAGEVTPLAWQWWAEETGGGPGKWTTFLYWPLNMIIQAPLLPWRPLTFRGWRVTMTRSPSPRPPPPLATPPPRPPPPETLRGRLSIALNGLVLRLRCFRCVLRRCC